MSSHLEKRFAELWLAYYPNIDLHSEYVFASPRRFRFDFAHLPSRIAIEAQGAIFTSGRHSRGSGLVKEYEKMNLAASLGWRVFYVSSVTINDYSLYQMIGNAIKMQTN